MKKRRFLLLFAVLAAGFTLLCARLFLLTTDSSLAAAAELPSQRRAVLCDERPEFYDCAGRRLTGIDSDRYALVWPSQADSAALAACLTASGRRRLEEKLQVTAPFAVRLTSGAAAPLDFDTFTLPDRYSPQHPVAHHLLGYLDSDGRGIAGLEAVFEPQLRAGTGRRTLEYAANARGTPIDADAAVLSRSGGDFSGVQLTLDREIQTLCETVADEAVPKGAVVVLDCATGAVRAMVSRPDFDPDDVAASLADTDAPLLNRALCAYNVGSVYKPLLAAAALDAGLSAAQTYDCTGSIEVDGFTYTCNDATAHGTVDLAGALVHSCNCFFIALGQQLGAETVYNMASSLRFGQRLRLWDGCSSAAGSMPDEAALRRDGELCLDCFGQGELLLTPLHLAAAVNCLANGGVYTEPSLVLRVGDEAAAAPKRWRVFAQTSADTVAQALVRVVEEGTGSSARPEKTTAAGKTGTAQTGKYNADGSEVVIGWFTGWFPAEAPRYAVAVMVENEGYGYESAAPVFARIADALVRCGY